jgi:hypothetical protein
MNAAVAMLLPVEDASRGVDDDWRAHEFAAGCRRRALPAPPGARAWLIEMAPGSAWPRAERTDTGETCLVIDGEAIEGEARYPAGTQVVFAPGSVLRLRTDTGARLFGFSLEPEAYLAAGGDPATLSGRLHLQQG